MSDESDKILDNLTNAAQRFTHFLQDNFPKECVEGEYATDTAIRILASLQTQKDIDEVTIKGLLQANNHLTGVLAKLGVIINPNPGGVPNAQDFVEKK